MTSALIGCTGFVGSHLATSECFDYLVHRPNVESIADRHFSRVVCAGLPAAKWIVNRNPQDDVANIERLESVLKSVSADRFILISTIDVYPRITEADEEFDCASLSNHSYGANRLRFEDFVRANFPIVHVVRLPALFGDGLKKNVVYDLLNGNQLERINPASQFQWYPLARLSADLQTIEARNLPLVNLFTEPLATSEIVSRLSAAPSIGQSSDPTVRYDLRTRHGAWLGGDDRYVMSAAAVLDSLAAYVHREQARR